MPRSLHNQTFEFPSYSFSAQAQPTYFISSLVVEQELPAILAEQSGTLTTRTADDDGVATLGTGHGIESADVVDVYFAGGVRYGMTATVAGDAVTLAGGGGDALPLQDDPVTVVVQLPVEINFDGDDAQVVAVIYRNASDITALASVEFQDTTNAVINALSLVHETANGGLDNIDDIAKGDDNAYSGERITQGHASHNSVLAAKMYIMVGITAPPA